MVRFLNCFQNKEGFDRILERVMDRKNWLSLEVLTNYVYALGSIHGILYRNFAIDYIPAFWAGVKENILRSPDNVLRQMEISKLEVISRSYSNLLKRVLSVGEKNREIERFTFDVALLTFNCAFLQQKVVGMKIIGEILRKVKLKDYHCFGVRELQEWITENKIFEKIFSHVDGHE